MNRIRQILANRTVMGILGAYCLFFVVLLATNISGMRGFPEEFPVIEFALPDVFGGDDLRLDARHGSPVLIYFFASW